MVELIVHARSSGAVVIVNPLLITPFSTAIVVFFALTLGLHLWLSFLIRRNTASLASFRWLAGLSLLTTCVWIGVVLVFIFGCPDCFIDYSKPQEITSEYVLFKWTFGSPFAIADVVCGTLPGLTSLRGSGLCQLAGVALLSTGLYMLGALVFAFVKRSADATI